MNRRPAAPPTYLDNVQEARTALLCLLRLGGLRNGEDVLAEAVEQVRSSKPGPWLDLKLFLFKVGK